MVLGALLLQLQADRLLPVVPVNVRQYYPQVLPTRGCGPVAGGAGPARAHLHPGPRPAHRPGRHTRRAPLAARRAALAPRARSRGRGSAALRC